MHLFYCSMQGSKESLNRCCSSLTKERFTNISHENQEISILMIKKARSRLKVQTSPLHQRKTSTKGLTKLGRKDKTGVRKQKILTCRMNNSEYVTCSVTINSNMYDSDFSITTSPLIYQLPTVGIDQCKH